MKKGFLTWIAATAADVVMYQTSHILLKVSEHPYFVVYTWITMIAIQVLSWLAWYLAVKEEKLNE